MSGRSVPVNALALLAGRVFSALGATFVVAYSAHRLDVDAFGLMVSTMAAGLLANVVVTFGTDTVVTRAVAADRVDAFGIASSSLRFQLCASVALSMFAGVAFLAGADAALLVQALTLIPLAVVTVANSVLRGRQRMDLLLAGAFLGTLAAVVALVIGLRSHPSAWVPVAATGIGSMVTAVVAAWFARVDAPGLVESGSVSDLLRETAPFAGMVILAAVGSQVGLLLVEFGSEETTGGYGVAVRLTEAARLVPAAAMGAFFPAMITGLHRSDRYRTWMRLLLGYAVLCTMALIALAGVLNRVLFDSQPGGATLTRILALGLVLTVVRLALSFELIADNDERSVLVSAAVGAAVTLVVGLVAAPTVGATGVAWAQLLGLAGAVALLARRSIAARGTESSTSPLI